TGDFAFYQDLFDKLVRGSRRLAKHLREDPPPLRPDTWKHVRYLHQNLYRMRLNFERVWHFGEPSRRGERRSPTSPARPGSRSRLATDPDRSREPRGVSGYVFAVGYEPDLDGIIRLQDDGKVVLRDPFPPYREALNPRFGVYVTEVEHDGQTLAGHVLLGGQV